MNEILSRRNEHERRKINKTYLPANLQYNWQMYGRLNNNYFTNRMIIKSHKMIEWLTERSVETNESWNI